MAIYSKCAANAAAGATANTFDNLGTTTLRSDASGTYGFWVVAAPAVSTAAEEVTGQLRVTSNDLNVGAQIYTAPPYLGGGPATNLGYAAYAAEFMPFVWPARGKENVVIDYSTNLPDPTAANSVVAALVYEAAGPGGSSAMARQTWPDMAPICKGAQSSSKATVTASVAWGSTVAIPAWAQEIVGCKQFVLPNLMTAGEERVGYIVYNSSMPSWDPQEWPIGAAIGAPLGTPVGKGAEVQVMRQMAMGFPTTGQNETITPNVVLNATVTTGDGWGLSIYYR